tara:strand:- start:1801 stop:2310 length:510 start_codon:yes stop_codon:yes gene_type:complete
MTIKICVVDQFDKEESDRLIKENLESLSVFIPSWEYLTEGDPNFKKEVKQVRVAAFDGDELVGLSWGRGESKTRFLMQMSLVIESHRGRGIYKSMLKMMLAQTREFDEIDSFHNAFNNKIIAAKLKAGFHIIGLDNSYEVGTRIRMRYFNNQQLMKIMSFRMGLTDKPL